ncbi:aromatase/cyclase [Streptomyces phaeofaciens JCM 4814]|uniref:Cyclase n=1 Tax=Streptomyces phaeofaciens TaxID=68254 RepID=A0A918HQE3_9ACTN|nr:SRPBCC family protein [Streptomyces phaeofaciens]GGT93997.1 cyclase [Streptomyces phaeofaciens]
MRQVTVRMTAQGIDPESAYRRISDFRRYPELTRTVREVTVHPPRPDGSVVSDWTVSFRNGLMCWTERDAFSPPTLSITFEQLSGDFETFEGSWSCEAHQDGTAVTFRASFDLGIPTLAEILDPVAESTLRTNIHQILQGLLGTVAPAEAADAAHG